LFLDKNYQSSFETRILQIWPEKHTFVPWILVNNVSLESHQIYQQNFVDFLCSWYNSDKRPSGCSNMLLTKNNEKCAKI